MKSYPGNIEEIGLFTVISTIKALQTKCVNKTASYIGGIALGKMEQIYDCLIGSMLTRSCNAD